ncbi:MAG: single-stranded-DNA-specific exonuclease, partial [Limisphaerales bacterium]
MQKRWNRLKANEEVVSTLRNSLKIHPVLCQLLALRGIHSFEEAKQFFRPSLTTLHDPMLMKDMPEAVDRINQAIKANEEILIYGDYDVDGATAVSLVYRVLERHHKNIRY